MLKKRAGVYIRVSTQSQGEADKASVPTQLKECPDRVENQGYLLADIYQDTEKYRATSGRNKGKLVEPSSKRKDRPEFQRLCKDIREGKIDVVIAWKWDRLGAGRGLFPLIDAISDAPGEVTVETVKEAEMAMLELQFRSIFRAELLKDMKDRLIMGNRDRLEKGRVLGAPPYGYNYHQESGMWVINETEAKWVKLIFKLYAIDRRKIKDIREVLIKEGAPQKRKKRKHLWDVSCIRKILKNKSYTGICTVKWDGETYQLDCPPIDDKRLFDKAQKVMGQNRTNPANAEKFPHLLTGLLRCAECGHTWQVTGIRFRYHGNGKRTLRPTPLRYYQCRQARLYPEECSCHIKVRAEDVEQPVWDAVAQYMQNPEKWRDKVLENIAVFNESKQDHIAEATKLEAQIEKLKESRQWIIYQASRQIINRDDFEAQIVMMDAEQSELELAHQEATQDVPNQDELEKMLDFLEAQIQGPLLMTKWICDDDPPEFWEGSRLEQLRMRKQAVKTLIDHIIIDPIADKLTIVTKTPFVPIQNEMTKTQSCNFDMLGYQYSDLFKLVIEAQYKTPSTTSSAS